MARMLKTSAEVIEALGGVSAVARDYQVRYQAPHNWAHYTPHIPSRLYAAMNDALKKQGCTASPALWGMWPHFKRKGMK
jgi:hypothetical protein